MAVSLDFICDRDECGHIVENVLCSGGVPIGDPPMHCGLPMAVHWMTLPQGVHEFTPFTTRNIHPDGKPLLVRNKGDLQRYYRQYGVVHYDDPGLVAQGGEIVRKGRKMGTFIDMGGRR